MNEEKIYIKHMVCPRCVMTAERVFREAGVEPLSVELGIVTLSRPLPEDTMAAIRARLEEFGFEVIDDKRKRLVEQIRVGVIEFVRQPERRDKQNLSDYLRDKCRREYSFLSKLYTEINGVSVEKYYIAQRVEYVKELLIYDELTVSEIADKVGYSSVAHLSAQFRNVTGISPTKFKQLKQRRLRSIDQI